MTEYDEEELRRRRRSAVWTAILLALVAAGIFVGYIYVTAQQ